MVKRQPRPYSKWDLQRQQQWWARRGPTRACWETSCVETYLFNRICPGLFEHSQRLGLGGVRVPILFGNNLLWNDLPHSKWYKFGCLEPSKIIFDFWNVLLVKRHLTKFVSVPPYEILVFLISIILFQRNERILWGKKFTALFQTHDWEKWSFSTRSYVFLSSYTHIRNMGAQYAPPGQIGLINHLYGDQRTIWELFTKIWNHHLPSGWLQYLSHVRNQQTFGKTITFHLNSLFSRKVYMYMCMQ